jgi:hypothetical protein
VLYFICHGPQLGIREIVCKSLSSCCGPSIRTRLFTTISQQTHTLHYTLALLPLPNLTAEETYPPGISQRHHVININVTSSSPNTTIIRRDPSSTCCSTTRVRHNISSISFQDCLTCIARSGDGDPVVEEVTVVA